MPSVFPPGARLGSRYRVARVVAHGPTAALYEAHDLETGEAVAFKWVHAPDDQHAALGLLADRAREAQRLHDPQLLRVRAVAREDDSLFVVSSWARGEPYSHLLAQHLMPLSQRLAALAAMLSALESAHEAGVAHCGLHPDNLYLGTRSGVSIKLLDLALNQTCCATLFGRPQQVAAGHHVFMAPEQLEPRYVPNARTDVFAAAVLIFQGLSGRLPFVAPDVAGLRAQFAHEPPRVDALRSDVPRELATLVAASLASKPEQRPAGLAELREQLESYARVVVAQPERERSEEPPSISVTQSLARGELVLTPKDAQEREPTQPISHHGEHTVHRRWNLGVASLLAGGTLLVALAATLWPTPKPRTPPALPRARSEPTPAAPPAPPATMAPPPAVAPASALPATKAVRLKKKRRHRQREDFRAGRPLTRDDF